MQTKTKRIGDTKSTRSPEEATTLDGAADLAVEQAPPSTQGRDLTEPLPHTRGAVDVMTARLGHADPV
ncbi:hypothetical protein [Actinomadura sp. BRA 177]|uniref:hypothetical protein n=1 Tax=Actinomadura sp. BRA 177 TaxID=2745202 RepID=UPI00159538AE|nr:hypothetical protein [Actinomadura sp. BRA 177]NVI86812.1 hypothetical protein [Actinomadura sp. BRA 177]